MVAQEPSRALVEALTCPSTYGVGVESVRVVETHISWVFLTGKIAYKVKKPVRLPFLDFSTLAARLRYCKEELRLNRRLAPEIYLDIVPIGGTADEPVIGVTPAIEYAVKMVEFPADARLDRVLARRDLSQTEIAAFAERLAAFHRNLEPAPRGSDYGSSATVRRVAAENLEQSLAAGAIDEASADALREWFGQQDSHVESLLEARAQAGAIRECHGDLHLENLIDWRGEIVAFDALEFDVALRFVDPIDEVAFLTMDLLAHGRADVGFRFLNRYLEVMGDYAGVALFRYYMIHRALVRAKVRALSAGAETAHAYTDLALQLCQPSQPTLFVTHGFSGSGKTTWTSELLAVLPAIRVRSDIVRKQQAGLGELDASGSPVGGGLYDEDGNENTYRVLADHASAILHAGCDVIVDATCLRRGDRERFAALAADTGARFRILDFVADPETLRARITARAARRDDPSEGTHDVLDWQLAHADGLDADELAVAVRIDTESETPAMLDEAILARVRTAP